jgi:hypothetical protein
MLVDIVIAAMARLPALAHEPSPLAPGVARAIAKQARWVE